MVVVVIFGMVMIMVVYSWWYVVVVVVVGYDNGCAIFMVVCVLVSMVKVVVMAGKLADTAMAVVG